MTFSQEKSQAAFDRVHELGGHGVWESDCVVISLDNTDVTDNDLALFNDFNFVEVLSLRGYPETFVGFFRVTRRFGN